MFLSSRNSKVEPREARALCNDHYGYLQCTELYGQSLKNLALISQNDFKPFRVDIQTGFSLCVIDAQCWSKLVNIHLNLSCDQEQHHLYFPAKTDWKVYVLSRKKNCLHPCIVVRTYFNHIFMGSAFFYFVRFQICLIFFRWRFLYFYNCQK